MVLQEAIRLNNQRSALSDNDTEYKAIHLNDCVELVLDISTIRRGLDKPSATHDPECVGLAVTLFSQFLQLQ